MVGAGGFLRYGLATITKAVTAGMKLFALALKDTKVLQVLIDGMRGRSSGLLVLAVERMTIPSVFITACCAETVVPNCYCWRQDFGVDEFRRSTTPSEDPMS